MKLIEREPATNQVIPSKKSASVLSIVKTSPAN